jgi:arsenite oxidase small subunit
VTRRQFLFIGAATVTAVTLSGLLPGALFRADVAAYVGIKIGTLSGLRADEPQEFRYPWDHPNCLNYLIKLGVPAGGGIGPDGDVVAFNTICPHMGTSLVNTYKGEHQVMGPCPSHLSTYDLTRHGMVVAGHATQGLPQILLEAQEDDIYATGVMALIYGFGDN